MEENNNNESQIKNTIKNEGKKLAKDGLKAVLKPLKKYIIIGVGIFIGILLTLGLLNIVDYTIKNIFSNLISIFTTSSAGDAEATTSETNDSVIYIDKNGYYKLKEDYSEKIIQQLEEQQVDTKEMGFDLENEEEKQRFRDMIDKYIKTEVETTFPKTDRNWSIFGYNDVDGNITVKRAFAETGEVIPLKYKKYSDFCSAVDSNNSKATEWFSVNPNNLKLCIAKWTNKTINYETEDASEGTVANGGELEIEELEYRSVLENYSVPLNFLTTMHTFSLDADFMEELVTLASGADKEEPLVITYVETQEQHTSIFDYEGKIEEKITSITEVNDSNQSGASSLTNRLKESEVAGKGVGSTISEKAIDENNASDYAKDVVNAKKQVTINYYGKLYVTKTDTWIKKTERSVVSLPEVEVDEGTIVNDIVSQGYLKDYDKTGKKYAVVDDEDSTKFVEIITTEFEVTEMIESLTGKSKTNDFSVIDTESEIVIQEFIDLIKKYPEVEDRIKHSPSNIFYRLQQDENTQKLEKIMRYVLYELNDVKYGVELKDLDFLLEDMDFLSVSDGIYDTQTIQEKVWYTLLSKGYSKAAIAGVMGNIEELSGFETNKLENAYQIGGAHSLGHTSKSYTDAVNNGTYSRADFISDHVNENCGAGYGLLQWTYGPEKEALYNSAKNSGKGIDNGTIQIQYIIARLSDNEDWGEWKKSTDPQEAAKILCENYVNPGATKEDLQKITEKAQTYYDQFKEQEIGTCIDDSENVGKGNYHSSLYRSTKGRVFTVLNQGIISGWGSRCNRAAAAIIASGYSNEDDATLVNTMNAKYAEAGDTIVPRDNYWNLYGLSLVSDKLGGLSVEEYTSQLREHLQNGEYAMIWMNHAYTGKSNTTWTGNIHWVAIIDYKVVNGKEKIVVADHRGAAWYDIDEFQHGIARIAFIRELGTEGGRR